MLTVSSPLALISPGSEPGFPHNRAIHDFRKLRGKGPIIAEYQSLNVLKTSQQPGYVITSHNLIYENICKQNVRMT